MQNQSAPQVHLFVNLSLQIACDISVYDKPIPDCSFKPSEITCPGCIAVYDERFDRKLFKALRGRPK